MADSVVRLRIDSSEYDNKLKNATTALNRFFDSARQGGQSIANADKSVEDAVRSFGNMAAKAQDARGKLNEMTRAFTEMSMQYKQLTDAEKQSPVGQAMAKSLDQLKGRINETKGQLAEVNKELGNTKTEGSATGSVLEQLAGKFGMSTKEAGLLGAALAAGKLALEAFEKTMQSAEGTADLLASTQYQLTTAVDGFFLSLNNGNFASFLTGLSDIITRAQDAYEAMDELSSFAVRYNPKNQRDMREIDTLLKEARALQAKGDKAGAAAKTAEATRLANEAKQNTYAYGRAEYNAGMSTLKNLLGKSGTEFTDAQVMYWSDPKNFQEAKDLARTYEKILGIQRSLGSGPMSPEAIKMLRGQLAELGTVTPKMQRAYAYMNARDTAGTEAGDAFIRATQQIYGLDNARFAVDAIQARIDRADAVANRPTGGGGGGGRTGRVSAANAAVAAAVIPEGSVAAYEKEIQELRKAQSYATDTETWKAYAEQIAMVTYEVKKLKGELADVKTPEQAMADYQSGSISSAQDFAKGFRSTMLDDFRQQAKETSEEQQQAAKETAEAWSAVGNSVNAVAGALAGLEDPAAQVMGTIAQAIANIALSFSQAMLKPKDPFSWIAFAAAGTATMISTISAIKSATAGSYAQGGIVPGNSYSGDRLTANVNSGELILNAAQQDNIASLLQGGGMSNMHLEAVVSGEQLRFVLNNNSRRRSRGEYVTTLMRN